MKTGQVLLLLSFFLIPSLAYAQSYNCPNGCTVQITPNPQTYSIPSSGQPNSNSGANPNASLGGVNLQGGLNWVEDQIAQTISNGIGIALPNSNGIINSTQAQTATGSGLQVIHDLTTTTFDINQFVTDLVNSFLPLHVSFLLVMVIGIIITSILIIRIGENRAKYFLILFVVVVLIAIASLVINAIFGIR